MGLRAVPVVVGLFIAFAGVGCSSVRPWVNKPLDQTPPINSRAIAQRDSSALFAVTLSGGGARAAAFGFGVLQELRETPCCWNDRGSNVLDAVDLISGVSGGSIVAAYFATFGAEGMTRFESEFLRQDFQHGLLSQLARPGNLYDLSSPWFGRSQLLQRRLDQLYGGATFGDIARRPRHPQLVVTATDLTLGSSFDFTAEQFALICSDLSTVPVSFAVAASSAVPLLLSPMTLRNYQGSCPSAGLDAARPSEADSVPSAAGDVDYRTRLFRAQELSYRDTAGRPYIHLVDGGLADNLGVRRLLDRALGGGGMRAAFSEVRIAPASVERLVIVTVNAARDPERRVDDSDRVPDTLDVVDSLLFGTGNRATSETQEFLIDVVRRWQESARTGGRDRLPGFAKSVDIFLIEVNLRDAPEGEPRRQLLHVPTALSISDDEVNGLIAAGREVLRASPEFQRLRRSLGAVSAP